MTRYRLIYTVLLTALLAGGSITSMAQDESSSTTTSGVHIHGNVYGGGKGEAKLEVEEGNHGEAFLCAKAMVGIVDTGVTGSGTEESPYVVREGGTAVNIYSGTVGSLDANSTLVEGTGNVYGGGKVGRVEKNTIVTIGVQGDANSTPHILGNVFGAGAGEKTHGYSALVRGNSSVTIQGSATVAKSVYGGGKVATVGKYTVVDGLPTTTTSGGECTVIIRDNATITGNVFGAGKGTLPYEGCASGVKPQHMNGNRVGGGWEDALVEYPEYDPTDYDQNKPAYANYIKFIKSLALASGTKVTISGEAEVYGSVYGGSENGFVQRDTQVKILETCTIGTEEHNADIFGGGRGYEYFAEAGIVRGKTEVYVNGGTTNGTVYGGGSLGNVNGTTEVNVYANKVENDYVVVANESEGVTITGNVYGGGMGSDDTFTCEKAMVGIDSDGIEHPEGGTTVRIFNGTVNGSVYGGGKIGRVEKNTVVTIGSGNGGNNTSKPYIKCDVYGAGAGVNTHGFSALVRGNSTVTIEGDAWIGKSVYGGGQIATVGRYIVIDSRPSKSAGGGLCSVHIQGHAIIGKDSEGDVFGAGKGVMPYEGVSGTPKSMIGGNGWKEYPTAASTDDKEDYFKYIQTLGLASDTEVTIGADASVKGSVYGGSENGFVQRHTQVTVQGSCEIGTTDTDDKDVDGDVYGGGRGDDSVVGYNEAGKVKGNTMVNINGGTMHGTVYGGGEKGYTIGSATVNMAGGTVNHDVYGGGAVADTNKGNGDEDNGYVEVLGLTPGTSSVDGLYENIYVETDDETAVANNTYYIKSGSDYVAVAVLDKGASLEGLGTLYEKSGDSYVLTEDDTAGAGKTYYTEGGVVVIITVGTSLEDFSTTLYEWSESDYGETTDETAVADKKYYTITHPTNVNLTGGTIKGDAYGGALGNSSTPAYVYGDVQVNLNNITVGSSSTGCIVNRVFGCNNVKGSPKANVTVHVYATQNAARTRILDKYYKDEEDLDDFTSLCELKERIASLNAPEGEEKSALEVQFDTYYASHEAEGASDDDKNEAVANIKRIIILATAEELDISTTNYTSASTDEAKATALAAIKEAINTNKYDVEAVYGGGNQAAYDPTTPNTINTSKGGEPNGSIAQVIIDGCEYTSIETVYGGGNAAAVPETNVLINAAYEIGAVFGGGNGKDNIMVNGESITNPGADVGINNGEEYGTGNANTLITGGYIHEAYGGSNQRGTIVHDINFSANANTAPGACPMVVNKMVNAGKNADVLGNAITVLGCMPDSWVKEYYGGADDANVHGNVELTITSGKFHKVFGGNNTGGIIMGHIKVNIEETGGCETPIIIDELYLGGNQAPYSAYGYYITNKSTASTDGKLTFGQRESETDTHKAVESFEGTTYRESSSSSFKYDKQPELNIISCTHIGKVFGGGLGVEAKMYANPTVNINMIKGEFYGNIDDDNADNPNQLGEIGTVYGGGNQADVNGNTTVNICTATKVEMTSLEKVHAVEGDPEYDPDLAADAQPMVYQKETVEGAYISGNVYGGGKGEAKTDAGEAGEAFLCAKAMVNGDEGTHVNIGNGIVVGSVYGGGEVGRVENNTEVTIGLANAAPDTSMPIIKGNVFGAGAGVNTHGYSALVRGTSTVTVQADAKVLSSVYGGGEKASVGRYKVVQGLPQVLDDSQNPYSGYCYVTIKDNAEIGPDNMRMDKDGLDDDGNPLPPDDTGYVFGAGKGVLPYEGYDDGERPQHMNGTQVLDEEGKWDGKSWADAPTSYDPYDPDHPEADLDADYEKFIKSLALATQTIVTIEGTPFVKGGVYGGSENGFVQHDTHVIIKGGQIGSGHILLKDEDGDIIIDRGLNRPYTAAEWSAGHLTATNADFTSEELTADAELVTKVNSSYAHSLPECASWPYGEEIQETTESGTITRTIYAPYDKFASKESGHEEEYSDGRTTRGGRRKASDGHTFFGNVFGGGSGYFPYRPGKWFEYAGAVYGNTYLTITGGHILTSVYGGNEMTDVGKGLIYDDADKRERGKCYVTMTGGTVGVPRTLDQIDAHPVTCYLFGAGKGDPRVFFNKSTNVRDVAIHISDDARIYGSVFGGGEDGHVLKDVTMNIGSGNSTLPDNPVIDELFEDVTLRGCYADNHLPLIGTWGTSYVDGNVFGAGRGFTGEAYTAGNVGGSVTMNLLGGTMYGSIYGGGRLGSVGYGLYPDDAGATYYGAMRPDNKDDDASNSNVPNFKRGYVTMTIGNEDDGTGPIIGNTLEYKIPSASNGPTSQGENPVPTLPADVTSWTDVQWTAWKAHNNMPKTEFEYNESKGYYMLKHTKGGNVYAAGMGRQTNVEGVNWWKLGSVKETKLTIYGGRILSNVYGGGELGAVVPAEGTTLGGNTEIIIQGGTIGSEVAEAVTTTTTPEEGDPVTTTDDVVRYTFGSVFGGGMGNEAIATSEDLIGGRVEGSTKITMTAGTVLGSVYGGGELAVVKGSHTTKNSKNENFAVGTEINISGGFIGKEKSGTTYFGGATMGNVYGGGKGSTSTFIAGLVKSNTKVSISNTLADATYAEAHDDVEEGDPIDRPTIYHNIYGGGAYASVGTYTYDSSTGSTTCATGTGKTEVIVTGGIIGIDGNNNGMVFGSSRGDVATPTGSPAVDPNDMLAWVNETHVVIGADGQGTTTPQINGSVYGSGENGHTYTNTVIDVHSGTIGIVSGSPIANPDVPEHPYTGPNFPNRGNVYGGGCGTDMYDSEGDGTKDSYNSLAGIVLGNATVNIDGGQVVRNVYGAGAMGSVGTMTTDGKGVTTFTSGGTTTIAISGGIVGVDGDENGNVFGAARGDATTTQKDVALVKTTDVQISGTAAIKGNVYGGGEIGCVGTFSETSDGRYVWSSGGLSKVSVTGTTAIVKGNVFGAGKGEANTFKCEKAMVRETSVSISNGTIGTLDNADELVEGTGNVYGGGEIGRVEYDTEVTVGRKSGETEGNGTGTPTIYGSVFGSGKGEETHGYSALVRGDTHVTVEGATGSTVGHSVYGGGKIASVGRYGLDAAKMPEILLGGGKCTVKVLGNAQIGPANASDDEGNVFGAGKGLPPDSYIENTGNNKETCSRRMMVYDPYNLETKKGRHTTANKGTLWWPYGVGENETPVFVWEYFPDDTTGPEESRKTGEEKYKSYLETLALATAPDVTIGGNAKVNGNVFGGGELGLTKGSVIVKIEGGTIEKNVYGGGSLADTNTTSTVGKVGEDGAAEKDKDDNYKTTTVHPTTIVRLTGGQVKGDVYGGGLGQVGVTGEHYTSEEIAGAAEGDDAYGKTTDDWKVEAVRNMPAYVYGNVLVDLNGTTDITVEEGNKIFAATGVRIPDSSTGCKVKRVFGCNNVNGSPRGNVIVHVYRTEDWTDHKKSVNKNNTTYNVEAVYGGGNNAAYEPKDAKDASGNYIAYLIDDSGESTLYKPCVYNEDGTYTLTGGDALSSICKTNVIIDGCNDTSIKEVYGGGNAAPTPATSVTVNSCYEIGTVFGGGNGAGDNNPGANVGYRNYSGQVGDNEVSDDKAIRKHNYSYGTGKAETCLYGGTIHQAFGGSNSKGNVREVAFSAMDSRNDCSLDVREIYGAGNKAFMDAKIEIELGCIDQLGTLYGGAMEADVNENIELNVTSGRFGKVFGGNNKGGHIYGTITVNIEETGCNPIIIEELYGGGREADYTAPEDPNNPGTKVPNSPLINIISATSIGKVYGGGLDASVEGNPTILINMEPGTFAADIDTDNDGEANDDDDAIGTIGTVFGGGYNGDIIGNTRVEVGTDPSKKAKITNSVFGGGENADVIGKTDVIIGPPIEAIENP